MTDPGYVLAGWIVTGAAMGGYLARVVIRSRRARKLLGPDEGDGWR